MKLTKYFAYMLIQFWLIVRGPAIKLAFLALAAFAIITLSGCAGLPSMNCDELHVEHTRDRGDYKGRAEWSKCTVHSLPSLPLGVPGL